MNHKKFIVIFLEIMEKVQLQIWLPPPALANNEGTKFDTVQTNERAK